jgi:hypothetical protein
MWVLRRDHNPDIAFGAALYLWIEWLHANFRAYGAESQPIC